MLDVPAGGLLPQLRPGGGQQDHLRSWLQLRRVGDDLVFDQQGLPAREDFGRQEGAVVLVDVRGSVDVQNVEEVRAQQEHRLLQAHERIGAQVLTGPVIAEPQDRLSVRAGQAIGRLALLTVVRHDDLVRVQPADASRVRSLATLEDPTRVPDCLACHLTCSSSS